MAQTLEVQYLASSQMIVVVVIRSKDFNLQSPPVVDVIIVLPIDGFAENIRRGFLIGGVIFRAFVGPLGPSE